MRAGGLHVGVEGHEGEVAAGHVGGQAPVGEALAGAGGRGSEGVDLGRRVVTDGDGGGQAFLDRRQLVGVGPDGVVGLVDGRLRRLAPARCGARPRRSTMASWRAAVGGLLGAAEQAVGGGAATLHVAGHGHRSQRVAVLLEGRPGRRRRAVWASAISALRRSRSPVWASVSAFALARRSSASARWAAAAVPRGQRLAVAVAVDLDTGERRVESRIVDDLVLLGRGGPVPARADAERPRPSPRGRGRRRRDGCAGARGRRAGPHPHHRPKRAEPFAAP